MIITRSLHLYNLVQMWVLILFFMVFSTVWLWLLWRCGASLRNGEAVGKSAEGGDAKQVVKEKGMVVVVAGTGEPTFLSVLLLIFKVFVYQGQCSSSV